MRRTFSRKRAALQIAYGKPWQEVALEWDARPLSLGEIAIAWTAAVQPQNPGLRYSAQSASTIIRAAKGIGQPAAATA